MNKTKIEWADYTWNPVTGCLHGCPYCYARRIAERFGLDFAPKLGGPGMEGAYKYDSPEGLDTMLELNKPYYKNGRIQPYPMAFLPTFHRYRLNEPQKVTKPSKVFVCSMADLFGDWVPDYWIEEVFKACEAAPQHTYLFLTKNPKKYYNWFPSVGSPQNFWLGASAVNKPDEKVTEVDGEFLTTTAHCTADTMRFFKNSFISFEPLLNNVMQDCDLDGIDWVIVGAQTGPGAKLPKPEWVQGIIDEARYYEIPVFLKDNLKWPEKIQEYPEGMRT